MIRSDIAAEDKVYLIYHGSDFDGECSGAIAFNFFYNTMKVPQENIILVPIDYEHKIDIKKLEGKIVVMMDYSLDMGSMFQIQSIAKEFHWIDHHKSIIDEYRRYKKELDLGINIKGRLETANTRGACELTYEYFIGSVIPDAVKLLAAFDVCGDPFAEDNDPRMMGFQYGLRSKDTSDITSSLWSNILSLNDSKSTVSSIYQEGRSIVKYEIINARNFLEKNTQIVSLYDNDNKLISDDICLFNKEKPGILLTYQPRMKHDFVCAYTHNFNKGFSCTLYTSKENKSASEIAELYGGGGHKVAAGFRIDKLPFIKE